MIETVVEFVWDTFDGDITSDLYQVVKGALGSYFGILSGKRQNNDKKSFDDNLKLLLSDEELLKQLIGLMDGKKITDSLNNNENTEIDISLGKNSSMNNSGNDNKESKIRIC
jgi:hypothetical protein